jgi:hypothetical protein
MTWQNARAQPTQGGAGQPHSLAGRLGFGADEITLPTCVMLSQKEEDPRWESQCGHETWTLGHPRWLADLTSGPPEPHFRPKHQLNPPINAPLHLPVESVSLASKVLPSLVLVELREVRL